ncbi:helix-turn-helix transcriptional regulator [Euzebya tangerina]|uniref:helix-turn-helix transcriptional regulator n=1 Tax=Euzebya tangerina TaxID=591198 RepID=UPI000E31863B|nr:WYL domain-containing protein [Euzebya tangerina]
MRASRLIDLLVRLQLSGGASATELAEEFAVSVRTVYRDVEALRAAGVPVFTEVGRAGGIRIDPAYRIAGLPRLDLTEARSVLFAVVPAIADQLGFDAGVADRALLPAMETSAEHAARVVRDRLLVEPTHWFEPPEQTPALAEVARAVWASRELRLTYREDVMEVRPLGLIFKGNTWYLLAQPVRSGRNRLLRLSRISQADVLSRRFARPEDFDLATAWTQQRESFLERMRPTYRTQVRVAPTAEPLLATLAEARPELPLPPVTRRDGRGWAELVLHFDDGDRATSQLLRFGADLEVLGPAELRVRMQQTAARLAQLYEAP